MRNARGFTFIEMVVVSVICLIVLGSALTLFIHGFRALETGETAAAHQQELNRALAWISDDLKQTSSFSISPSLPQDGLHRRSVSFRLPGQVAGGHVDWSSGEEVTYILEDGALKRNNLNVALLKDVSFFRDPARPGEVSVILQAENLTQQGVMKETLSFNVTMRN